MEGTTIELSIAGPQGPLAWAKESMDNIYTRFKYIYRPQMKFVKVMFLHMSVSHCSGGVLPQCMLGYPPGADTLREQTPPSGTPPSLAHPLSGTPPSLAHPPLWHTPLSGTHPSGTPPLAHPPLAHTPLWHTPPSGTPPPLAPLLHRACWEIQSMRGRYASYWNAILLYAMTKVKVSSDFS